MPISVLCEGNSFIAANAENITMTVIGYVIVTN